MPNEVEITGSRDTGNSPKNKFVQEIAVALETANVLDDGFSDEMSWQQNEDVAITGDKMREAIRSVERPVSIIVEHAISHGKVGASNGEATMSDGSVRRFAHFITFTNTKANVVATIKSYTFEAQT